MGKSKLKTALLRKLGKDPVKQKQLKRARKVGAKRAKKAAATGSDWQDEDSDDVPDLVDTAINGGGVDGPAVEEATDEGEDGEDVEEADGEDGEEEDEDGEEADGEDGEEEGEEDGEGTEEEDDSDDVALSDIESDGDFATEDVIPYQKLTIDNTAALTSLRNRIAMPIAKAPFSEHQSLSTAEPVDIHDVDDDLTRELAFYKQALEAVQLGRALLRQEKIPFERPADYFAEMMKDDQHMGQIKGKLLEEAERKKRSQEARKLRDLKKFGKQVQVAKLQEREKEKKQAMEKISQLKRKRAGAEHIETVNEESMFDIALDEQTKDVPRRGKGQRTSDDKSRAKRQKRDAKFGFGGKKRHAKSNDAISSGQLGDFSSSRNKASFSASRGGKHKTASRPGKSRRAGARR